MVTSVTSDILSTLCAREIERRINCAVGSTINDVGFLFDPSPAPYNI